MTINRQFWGKQEGQWSYLLGEKARAMSRGEKITWGVFALTSMQLAFLQPHIALIHGVRDNLFSGVLCFIALAVVLIFAPKDAIRIKSPAFIISGVLAALAVASGLTSIAPFLSSCRVFILLASGLGGFWSARILLRTPENQHIFKYFCLFLLCGVLLIGVIGLLSRHEPYYYFDPNIHPFLNIIVLLTFAPLALLDETSSPLWWLSLLLLGFCFIISSLSGELSGQIFSLGILLIAIFRKVANFGIILAVLLIVSLFIVSFVKHVSANKYSKGSESIYYRIENFPFAWHIAKVHPWLGIGLRAPKNKYLEDYVPRYHHVTKQEFAQSVERIVSSDNTFLTFMAGLGFPFLIIYTGSLIVLVGRLAGMCLHADASLGFNPLALLLPISACLLYALLFDALLFPQICWFFHIFLGLIPFQSRRLAAAVQPVSKSVRYGS